MRTTSVVLGAVGQSQWIPCDIYQTPIGISLGCTLSNGASLTYTVQHTFDSLGELVPTNISRSTTTATATIPAHGAKVGDSIIVEGTGSGLDGVFPVASVPTADTVTYTVPNSGPTSITGKTKILRVFNNSGLVDQTANSDGNYAFPVTAVRIAVTALVSGSVTLTLNQG